MVNNSLILLDALLKKKGVSNGDDSDKFEFFVISEILKNYSLSNGEINSGIVDGGMMEVLMDSMYF